MKRRTLFAASLLALSAQPYAAEGHKIASVPEKRATQPVEIQKIPDIMRRFDDAETFRKKAVTFGRLPYNEEIDTDFPTYVSNGKGGYKLETTNVVTEDVVIARNPKPVVGHIYNQWLVPFSKWKEIYGKLPSSSDFKPYQRLKTIKAIKIDDQILTLLGSKDGKTARIKVSWNPDGMIVYKGGYLANGEYGIAPEEMLASYEKVPG
ncbi:hypothetical protein NF212_19945 [Parasalinivibrio latis]|uniref:hypothetical protein n=1 Tax=Parasalinivibrio latis TaxID=2952610 RepID=UPI0030E320FE